MSDLFRRLFSLEGRVALITGASGGIGSVLAVAFAEAGAIVAVHGSTRAKADSIRERVEKAGGKAVAVAGNLRGAAACQQLVAETQREMDRLDILVNCAGTNRRKPIRDVTEDDWDAIADVNLKSVFFLCQAVHPIMKRQKGGRIINIGSVTSTDGLGGVSVYGATKSAVWQLTRTMALEWAKDNVLVNCLAPGFLHTPLTAEGLWGDTHRKKWLNERIALGRPGQPSEVVGAALLLASPAASYITGQIINVDGGYLAGGSWLREDE